MVKSLPNRVVITAAARLHLGFLDPGAALGRRFGSIGLAIDGLATVVEAHVHDSLTIEGAERERATGLVERLCRHYRLKPRLRLSVARAIPGHAGLGSGTQLALAIGTAVTRLHGHEVATAEIGAVLGRGRRSGIGLGLFDHGGLIVDGGQGAVAPTPPAVSRLEFPGDWRALLVFDHGREGLSGGAEVRAFDDLEPMPQSTAAHLCHLTLMRLLPAVAEADFAPFASAVGEIQAIVGDHFAGVQSGRFTSQQVAEVMRYLGDVHALAGLGQSSWGPTAFVFLPDEATAQRVLEQLRSRFAGQPQLEFVIAAPRNRGGSIDLHHAGQARRIAGA